MNCHYCEKKFVDSMYGLIEMTFHEILCIRSTWVKNDNEWKEEFGE